MSEENKTDGHHVGSSTFKSYNSYVGNTNARLEVHDCITIFVKLNHFSVSQTMKMDRAELLVLREVLNKWFDSSEKHAN